MEMERNSVDRKTKIILPATIHEEYKDGMWIAEVAMVDKEEFSKVPNELVRCKDCEYGDKVKNGAGEDAIECHWCLEPICHHLDWYCAGGERKEG